MHTAHISWTCWQEEEEEGVEVVHIEAAGHLQSRVACAPAQRPQTIAALHACAKWPKLWQL